MLRELRTFIAVARHGTFAGAGAHIGLTQSAVSAQMQRLEAHLGFALFDRTGRSATLNNAGRRTLELADELIALYARLAEPEGDDGRGGTLGVGTIASAHAVLLPDAIAMFRRTLPAWRIRIVPGVSLNLLAQVDAGETDMAVIIRPPFSLPSELQWRTLVAEPFVLLAPSAYKKKSWRELIETQSFIRYDRRSFGGRQVELFLRKKRIDVHDAIEVDELQGIAQLVARGMGVALAPKSAGIGAWPRGVVALDLGDDTFYREIGLVERTRRLRDDAATRLADCIVQAAAQGARASSSTGNIRRTRKKTA
ncbi:LysR family transcriptional regulator [Caballeronia sp. LZ016]|uniref:LysR family transcriptional regulator n=1 Tax=Caballeronia sp. LZ016 TaxID=3038554 RepID=UPI0028598841|nr:LysR family transcriptional regulator [Caballeronia sp. LZ016]MDR5739934.1 LysR family transcriptional regulator [Caballeronia sp. LZ016]